MTWEQYRSMTCPTLKDVYRAALIEAQGNPDLLDWLKANLPS